MFDRQSGKVEAKGLPNSRAPEASVVIACFNATATLPLQLEALSQQQDAPPFEVIVADNGSSDDLRSVAGFFSDRLDIHYVWAGQMPGAAYARNVGMSIARAEKWLFCDADDVVASDWVVCGVTMLDSVPVFSGGGCPVRDSELKGPMGDVWGRLWPSGRYQPIQVAHGPEQWPIIMGGNFGMTRATALHSGGFDASLSRGVEDNDLAVRLERSGVYVTGGSPRILYRKRDGFIDRARESYVSGKWHMALVERHGIADRSPELRGTRWMVDPLRVVGSALRNAAKGRDGDWPAVCSRAALSTGLWSGWLRFHVQNLVPEPMVGAGLGGCEPDLPADAAVLVLSPHLDDALFSCAELIRRTAPDVWTVFAGDPRPVVTTAWDESCGFPDSHTLVTQRRREDLGAFDGTDAQVRHLDMLDGVYTTPDRRAEDLARLGAEVRDWVAAHRGQTPVVVLPACAGVSVSPGAADRLLGRVAPLLSALRARGAGKDAAGGREDGAAHSEGPANRAATVSDDGRTSSGAPLLGHASTMLKHLKHRLYQRRRARAQQIGLAVNGDHVAVRDAVLATLAGIRDVGGASPCVCCWPRTCPTCGRSPAMMR